MIIYNKDKKKGMVFIMKKFPESDIEQILELPDSIQDNLFIKHNLFDTDKWDRYLSDTEFE